MTVFIFIYRYSLGGVETFATTLARALRKNHGVNAIIYVMIPESVYESRERIAKNGVPVLSAYSGKFMIISMNVIASLLSKMGFKNFRQKTLYWFFKRKLKTLHVDVVHSNYHLCDEFTHKASIDVGIPYVVTDHGSYRTSDDYSGKTELMRGIAKTTLSFIYLTDLSLTSFANRSIAFNSNCQIKRIWNGWDAPHEKLNESKSPIFTFGMISRGEASKGWREVIEAFLRLKAKTTKSIQLILVGDGDYLVELSKEFRTYSDISFRGPTEDPNEVVEQFNVGLLPSKYVAECMPYAVIQYLSKGIPCIVTNNGSMGEMVRCEDQVAGMILNTSVNHKDLVTDLFYAMSKLLDDEQFYTTCSKLAERAFNKFDIGTFSAEYYSCYEYAVATSIKIQRND